MEKKICSYETLFAVSGNLAEDESKAIVEKFVNLIKDNATDDTLLICTWGVLSGRKNVLMSTIPC